MAKVKDLTYQKFGRLTVITLMPKDPGKTSNRYWECICDCGNKKVVRGNSLTGGDTISCGCVRQQIAKTKQAKATNSDRYKDTKISALTRNKKKTNNKSGVPGVYWIEKRGKWIACIGFKGKNIHLGYFEKVEYAVKARQEAEEKYFKPIIEEYKELKLMEA